MPLDAFLSDAAITKPENDRLGRAAFAKRLASALLSWKQEDSIVIGLFGPWGSGKTSVVNMTLSYLNSATNDPAKEDAPIVVKFNPWHFSDQGHLLGLFFGELLQGIRQGAPQKFEWLKTKLGDLGEMLSPIGDAPIVGEYVKPFAGVAKALGQKASMVELRKEADKAFRDLGRRVIIVVDDIDRLTQSEIRQLFQTIKLNADFPNTVYLIAADRLVVEKSLRTQQGVSGRAYLEKIVQATFDVPMPDPSRISNILNAGLDDVITPLRKTNWDDTLWDSLYDGGFRNIFANLRDVKRFVGTLSFTLPMVQGEINPVDFIGLEAVRVFAPDVYDEIARGKPVFVGSQARSSDPELAKAARESVAKEIERIMTKAGARRAGIEGICRQLFPMLEMQSTLQELGTNWMHQQRIARRIAAPDMFDRYFLLGIPAGDISQAELMTIRELAVSRDQLIEHLKQYSQDGRLWRLTELLPAVIADLDDAAIPTFCEALLGAIESYPDQRFNRNSWGTTSRLTSLIARALMRLPEEDRCAWFRQRIISREMPYATLLQLTREERLPESIPRDPVFSDQCYGELKTILVQQLRETLASGYHIKNLPGVLGVWKRWSDNPTEVDEYVSQRLATPENALTFVADSLVEVRIPQKAGSTLQTNWLLDLETLSELIYLKQLGEKVQLAKRNKPRLTDQEARAIEVFKAEYSVAD